MEREQVVGLIAKFLEAERRERHEILRDLTPHLTREDVIALAPAVRDPSPRTSSRVAALLARHALDELFEAQLAGLKPGKVDQLRGHYRRLRAARTKAP